MDWGGKMMAGLITRLFRGQSATGSLICHLGPPKTATTAVQASLQKVSGAHVRYLGTFQPRNQNERSGIYSNLMKSVKTDPSRLSIYRIQRKIDRALNFGTDLIISDEMLLVNQHGAPFEHKLHRLSQLIGRYPCVIVISLREPVAALKSLYAEFYFRQGKIPGISFEEFLVSGQARVFDYPYLLATLHNCGFDNVRGLQIKRGHDELNVADFTGCPEHDQLLPLGSLNETEASLSEEIDRLVVPEGLAAHLKAGYAQTIETLTMQNSRRGPAKA